MALVAGGLLLVCLAVTAYALGQKLVPGLHLAGVFTLDQTGLLPRLQEPLGYWNALALLVAMGIPVALVILVDRGRPDGLRLGGGGRHGRDAADHRLHLLPGGGAGPRAGGWRSRSC